jgi:hypothetical protein
MKPFRTTAVVIVLAAALGACGGGQKTIGLKSREAQLQAETTSTQVPDTSTTSTGATPISGSASSSVTVVARPGTTSPPTTKAPPPTPTTTVGNRAATVTVTEADDGKTYALHRGDRLVVQLGPGYQWTEPASSNEAVLARTSGSTSGDGSAQATFAATTAGAADVTATGTAPPSPCRTANPPCMMPDYARQFRVSVSVS